MLYFVANLSVQVKLKQNKVGIVVYESTISQPYRHGIKDPSWHEQKHMIYNAYDFPCPILFPWKVQYLQCKYK